MSFNCYGRCTWWCGIALLAWLICSPFAHAQSVNIEQLHPRADAIVVTEVAFVPYGDMVLLGEVLHGELIELSSTNELLGECLPGKARVKDFAEEHEHAARGKVYNEALTRASYTVVAFLKHSGNGSEVICDGGPHSTENWETDPRFAAWRARLDRLLRDRE